MDKAELLDRTKAFGLRVLKLVDHLPRTTSGRAIGNQLIRSGISIGANYRAACRSRSRAEFASKIGVVAEEADETVYWLQLIRDGDLLSTQQVAALLKEADELTAIFTAGRRTSTKNQTSNLKPQTLIGLCPGAEYGPAKRWLPDRFAEVTKMIAQQRDIKWILPRGEIRGNKTVPIRAVGIIEAAVTLCPVRVPGARAIWDWIVCRRLFTNPENGRDDVISPGELFARVG